MRSFQDILDYLKSGNSPNVLVRTISEAYTGHEGPGDPGEFIDFMEGFIDAVRNEETKPNDQGSTSMKGGAQARVFVLETVRDWAVKYSDDHGRNAESPHFRGVCIIPFAYQLALRVRKPSLLNQEQTALCGTVAIVYTFGKETPLEFAKMAMQLFESGQGMFRHTFLEPSQKTKLGYPKRKAKGLCEADYVILASVRECGGLSNLGQGFHVGNQTLTAGTVCTMLEQAGYLNVEDHTFINVVGLKKHVEKTLNQSLYFHNHKSKVTDQGSIGQKLLNLMQAQQHLMDGRFVLLLGHGDISKAVQKGRTEIPYSILTYNPLARTIGRHWTAIRKIEVNTPQKKVTLRVITWGQRCDGSIDLHDFLNLYEGFVSASP